MGVPSIVTKRVYSKYDEGDGFRILVDRLWPRGLTKEKVHADEWAKSVAPSSGLRKAFAHDPAKWEMFQKRYVAELEANPAAQSLVEQIRRFPDSSTVTLLYAARNEQDNEAVVLQHWLRKKLS